MTDAQSILDKHLPRAGATDGNAEPQVGLFRGMSFDKYQALPGLHKTSLHVMVAQTPAHYHYAITHPDETDTPAKRFGRLVHTMTLEPSVADERYVVAPETAPDGKPWDRRYKAHKEAWAAWAKANAGREIVDPAMMLRAAAMVSEVRGHRVAKDILADAEVELSVQWVDPGTQLVCKARPDVAKGCVLADLKTCNTADPTRFPRDAYAYGYWFQAAFYLDGCRAVGLDVDTFCIIAVESDPPHCVAVYQLDPAEIELARAQYHGVLQQIVFWTKQGRWPGYSDELMDLVAPPYAGLELMSRMDA